MASTHRLAMVRSVESHAVGARGTRASGLGHHRKGITIAELVLAIGLSGCAATAALPEESP